MSDLPCTASASNHKSRRSSILKKSPSRKLLELDTNVDEVFSLVDDEGRKGCKRRVSFAHTYQVKEISRVADIADKWPNSTSEIDTTNLDIPKLAFSRKNSIEVGADGLNALLSAPIVQSLNENEISCKDDNTFNICPPVDSPSLRHAEPIESVPTSQTELMRNILEQPVVMPSFLAHLQDSKQLTSVGNHPLGSTEAIELTCTQNKQILPLQTKQGLSVEDGELNDEQKMFAEDMELTCTLNKPPGCPKTMQEIDIQDKCITKDQNQISCIQSESLTSIGDMQVTYDQKKDLICIKENQLPCTVKKQSMGSDDMQLTCILSNQIPHNEDKLVSFSYDSKLVSPKHRQSAGADDMQMTCTQKELFTRDEDMQLTCTQSNQIPHNEDKQVSFFHDSKLASLQHRQSTGADDMQMTCTQKELFTRDEDMQSTCTQSNQMPHNEDKQVSFSHDSKLASLQHRQSAGADDMQMTCTQKELFTRDEDMQSTCTQSNQIPHNEYKQVSFSHDSKLASLQHRQSTGADDMQMSCTQKELFTPDEDMQLTCTQSNQLPHNEDKQVSFSHDSKLASLQHRQSAGADDMQMTCPQKELFTRDEDMQSTCTQSNQMPHNEDKQVTFFQDSKLASPQDRQSTGANDMQMTCTQKKLFTCDKDMPLTCTQSNQLAHYEDKQVAFSHSHDSKMAPLQRRQSTGADDMQMTCTQKELFTLGENVQLTCILTNQLSHIEDHQVISPQVTRLVSTHARQRMGSEDIHATCASKELFPYVKGKLSPCTGSTPISCTETKPPRCAEDEKFTCSQTLQLVGSEEMTGMQGNTCTEDKLTTLAINFGLECSTEKSIPGKIEKNSAMDMSCPDSDPSKSKRHETYSNDKVSVDDTTDVPLVLIQATTADVDSVFKDNQRPDHAVDSLCGSMKDEEDFTRNITMEEFVRDYMNVRIRANQKVALRSRRSLIAHDSAKPESLPELVNVYIESCYAPAYEQFIERIQDKLNSIQADTLKNEKAISLSNPEIMKLIRFGSSQGTEELIKEVDELAINCKKLAKQVYWKLAKSRLSKMLSLCGNKCVAGELLPALERFQEYGDVSRLLENSTNQLQSALEKLDKEQEEVEKAGAVPSDEQVASYQRYIKEIQQLEDALKSINEEEDKARRCNDEYKQLMRHITEIQEKLRFNQVDAQTKYVETVKKVQESKILKRYVLWDSVSDEPLCKRFVFFQETLVFVFNLSKENMVLSTAMESCIPDDVSPSDIRIYKFLHHLVEFHLKSTKLNQLQRFDEALNLVCCSIAEAQRLCLEINKLSLDFTHCNPKIGDTHIVVHFYSNTPCTCSVKIRFDFYDESNSLCDFLPIRWCVVADEPIFGVSATEIEKSLLQMSGQTRLIDFASHVKKLMASGKPV